MQPNLLARGMARTVDTAPRYTWFMVRVAYDLRAEERGNPARASAAERLDLALQLGEDDLEIFCRARQLTREEGRRRLRLARQVGRRPSRCLLESL